MLHTVLSVRFILTLKTTHPSQYFQSVEIESQFPVLKENSLKFHHFFNRTSLEFSWYLFTVEIGLV